MGKTLSPRQERKVLEKYKLDNDVINTYKKRIAGIDAEIQSWNNHIDEVKGRIKQLQQAKIITGQELLPQNILWELYYKTGVSATTICELFGIQNAASLRQMIEGCVLTKYCSKCGMKLEFHPTSKTNLQELLNNEMCDSCEKQNNHARRQQYRQMQDGLRIQELKAMDYSDYLKSPEWDEMRKKMLRRAGYTCQLCNADKVTLNVHHKTYERLGEENYDDLIVLCEDCHAKFHDKMEVENEISTD